MAKKEKSIRLSPEHGVNPSIMLCFYCGVASGVALLGKLKGDKAAPRQAVYDKVPCDKCEGHMKQGVILISVRAAEHDDHDNPYRTGGWVVVKEAVIRRMVGPEELVQDILRKRVAFVPDQAWDAIGLPRGTTPPQEGK